MNFLYYCIYLLKSCNKNDLKKNNNTDNNENNF